MRDARLQSTWDFLGGHRSCRIAQIFAGRFQDHSSNFANLSMVLRGRTVPEPWPLPRVRTSLQLEASLLDSHVQELLGMEEQARRRDTAIWKVTRRPQPLAQPPRLLLEKEQVRKKPVVRRALRQFTPNAARRLAANAFQELMAERLEELSVKLSQLETPRKGATASACSPTPCISFRSLKRFIAMIAAALDESRPERSLPLNTVPISSDNPAALACHISTTRSTVSEAVEPPIIGSNIAIYFIYDAEVGGPLKRPLEDTYKKERFYCIKAGSPRTLQTVSGLSHKLAPRFFAEQDNRESRHQPLQPPRCNGKSGKVHSVLRTGVERRSSAHTVSPLGALPLPLRDVGCKQRASR